MNVRNSYNNPFDKGGILMNYGNNYGKGNAYGNVKGKYDVGSKYVTNINQGNGITRQEKVVAFGQGKDENYFKQTLRKSYDMKHSDNNNKLPPYNIITNLPNNNGGCSLNKEVAGNIYSSPYKNEYQKKNIKVEVEEDYYKQAAQRYHNNRQGNNDIGDKPMENNKGETIIKNSKEYYNLSMNCIKEYAYQEDQNAKHRNYMEDQSLSVINFNNSSSNSLFCIFDGHGGDQVSKFLTDSLPSYFSQLLPSNNLSKTFSSLFSKLDLQIKQANFYNIGSTACVVYITTEDNRRVLYSANIGDTRSVMISRFGFKRLSYDHRASDPRERDRIMKGGGLVFNGRVYGQLMLSRSFGDWGLKTAGLISEPYITRIEIKEEDRYVVIASDGIWDVCEDDDVYKIGQLDGIDNAKKYVKEIVNTAIKKGAVDNLSCFVIKLN